MYSWGNKSFPMVITIFSAPNYCEKYKNKGALIRLNNNDFDIDQFHFTQSPYYLPNFMNLINWSIPFVSEKILDMTLGILKHVESIEDPEITESNYQKAF